MSSLITITFGGKTGILQSSNDGVYIQTNEGKQLMYSFMTPEQFNSCYGEEILTCMTNNILANSKGCYRDMFYRLQDLLYRLQSETENNYKHLIITSDWKIGFLESENNSVYIRTINGDKILIYSPLTQEQIDSFYGADYLKAKLNIENIEDKLYEFKKTLNLLGMFLDACKYKYNKNTDSIRSDCIITYERKLVYVIDCDKKSIDVLTEYAERMKIPYKEYEQGFHYMDGIRHISAIESTIKKMSYDDKLYDEKRKAVEYLDKVMYSKLGINY
jgi:hypothetical protein